MRNIEVTLATVFSLLVIAAMFLALAAVVKWSIIYLFGG